ncbi:hypothetical protein N7541_008815 [Penicillium brevicompactum]|uniref:Glycosyl transferase CAP10 domain-containing protein n=1 Tax=Penicillium brevicompactum TaxID=5074 RepID=A0A9W9QXP3_PENBR|nr:hypothetical protein N7541_008815 [Penicillium brevicompactum]
MILLILHHIRVSLLGMVASSEHKCRYQSLDETYKGRGYYSRAKKPWILTLSTALALTMVMLYISPSPVMPYSHTATYDKTSSDHPVLQLTRNAQSAFNETLNRQSKTLRQAVREYKRRYKMPPPPGFDHWYKFATERETVLIDEFDVIYHALLPFWGLEPSVFRTRTREDLGNSDNGFMSISIRNGRPFCASSTQLYQRVGTMSILKSFAKWLPDMDLAFNEHDEPRVVVPHEELSQRVTLGREAHARLSRVFSPGDNYTVSYPFLDEPPPVSETRYRSLQFQNNWASSTLSCPQDSPSRHLNGNAVDDTASYATEPLGFIFNQTAFSDVCRSPLLQYRLGFFESPHTLKLTNDLTPVFSTSKPSSFQDIPVPSPWYFEKMAAFDESTDFEWDDKTHQLYWRGGNTGGHTNEDTWRNTLRQRVIGNLTRPNSARYVLQQRNESTAQDRGSKAPQSVWQTRATRTGEYDEFFDLKFTTISHCENNCDSQIQFFGGEAEVEEPSKAWNYRYLLDMDGWAYSGRFYSFMNSKSLPFKLSIFREWHQDILIPWVHYIPLNKDAEEILELIRYFEEDPTGGAIAQNIAAEGRSWAKRSLRESDMEVYMFRLLLEYARLQDDDRETLAYSS